MTAGRIYFVRFFYVQSAESQRSESVMMISARWQTGNLQAIRTACVTLRTSALSPNDLHAPRSSAGPESGTEHRPYCGSPQGL